MDKYFLPQIRVNSGSSPKEENAFATNHNIKKINPTLKLSKGERKKKNGNLLRPSTEFYTHTEPLVKLYSIRVIHARGSSLWNTCK